MDINHFYSGETYEQWIARAKRANREYCGITYPHWLIRFRWQKWLWQRLMCRGGRHLLDEVVSWAGTGTETHYLVCDVCQLMVGVTTIDDTHCEIKPHPAS